MIPVSDEFKDALDLNRNYLEYVDITLSDGTELSLTNKNLWNGGVTIEDAVSSSDTFDIGAAIINSCSISISNIYDDYSDYVFEGAEVNVQIGLLTDENTIEKLQKGVFLVDEAKYNNSIITLSCLDNMAKFDKSYSESTLQYPASLHTIVSNACTVCGVQLNTQTFPHDDYVIQIRPDDEAITFREIIQWCAQIAGCFARCDRYGRLELKWFNQAAFESGASADDYHSIKSIYSMEISKDDVVITGVRVVETNDTDAGSSETIYQSGEAGYVISVEGNMLLQGGAGQTVAAWLGEQLIGFRFRPGSVQHASDPSIEAGDMMVLTDRKQNTYNMVVSSTKFSTGSRQTTSSNAKSPIRNSADRYSSSTKNYVLLRGQIQKEKTNREQAIENLSERINNSSGAYTTVEEVTGGGSVFYLHNKPDLADSDMIWKMTAEAWGVSTDGGKTYNAGMTVDGDTIVRILTATGVNADWIDTGAITVRDNDGNVIFSVDIDTKQVIISGDKMVIGGRPATEVIQDAIDKAEQAEETANEAKILALTLTNDYQSIPVDAEGNYEEFPECTTTAIAMYGNTDVTSSCVFSVEKSTSITGSWDAGTKTYTVFALSQDDGWVDITATYLNTLTVTKRFTVAKLYAGKSGESYTIEASDSIIKIGSSGLNPMAVTFRAYKNTEDGRTAYQGRFKIEENREGVGWETVYLSESDESEITWEFIDAITTAAGLFIQTAGGKNIVGGQRMVLGVRCTLFLSGGTTQTIDAIDIPVVKDLDALTHEEVFNLLTNFGQIQGIYQEGNQIYISATYIKSGTMSADLIKGGTLELGGNNNQNAVLIIKNASGAEIGRWDKDGFRATVGVFSGELQAASGTFSGNLSAAGGTFKGNLSAAGGTFKGNLSAAGGTFKGNLSAASGTFTGSLSAASGTFQGHLTSPTGTIGGFTIASSALYTGSHTSINSANAGVYLGSAGISCTQAASKYVNLQSGYLAIVSANGASSDRGIYIRNSSTTYSSMISCNEIYIADYDSLISEPVFQVDSSGLYCSGSKNRVVRTDNYGLTLLYCYEMTSPMFGDIGSGVIGDDGTVLISLDDSFYETVNTKSEYYVFLQKEGEGDLWVQDKQNTYFMVQGTPGLRFAWEAKARQKDFEYDRLENYSRQKDDIDYEEEAADYVQNFYDSLEVLIIS